MNHLTKYRTFNQLKYLNTSVLTRKQSTNVQVEEKVYEKSDIKEFKTTVKIPKKTLQKKPQKPPFVKNFIVGIFDTDLLAYPEVFSKEEHDLFEKQLLEVEGFTQDLEGKSVTEQFDAYKNGRYLGLRMPSVMGGRNLCISELCRYTEVLSKNPINISMIHNDQLGMQLIHKIGNSKQKAKYLPNLISGKSLAAFCLSEAASCDPLNLVTKATPISSNEWVLNGEKNWIVNGDDADLMIVFARTESLNKVGLKENNMTAFIVDRNMNGITSKQCEASGLDGTSFATINFDKTQIPNENILGTLNDGEKVGSSVLTEFRLLTGPVCIYLTKTLLNQFIQHCKVDRGNIIISDTELVQSKISKVITRLYAMESMTYFTASLLDLYEDQDCELEAAIVKVFAAEQCLNSNLEIMTFLGTPSQMTDHWCNKLTRDSLSNLLLNENIDNLKLIIALLGLQHAGACMNEEVKMNRNPLHNPLIVLKRLWAQRKQLDDNPTLTLNLKHYLHPSLMQASERLEYCILRLQFATQSFFIADGAEVMNKHINLRRLAESLIDTYAMAACLSRASRSYCNGFANAEHEITLANLFCFEAKQRVRENLNKICDGPFITQDVIHKRISNQSFHSGSYFVEHPMKKEF